MFHEVVTSCLGFSLERIETRQDENGVVWYKVSDFLDDIGLSNTTAAATQKLPAEHRRKFEPIVVNVNGREFKTRPVYVTETGLWLMIMLNNNPRLRQIREQLALVVLPGICDAEDE